MTLRMAEVSKKNRGGGIEGREAARNSPVDSVTKDSLEWLERNCLQPSTFHNKGTLDPLEGQQTEVGSHNTQHADRRRKSNGKTATVNQRESRLFELGPSTKSSGKRGRQKVNIAAGSLEECAVIERCGGGGGGEDRGGGKCKQYSTYLLLKNTRRKKKWKVRGAARNR